MCSPPKRGREREQPRFRREGSGLGAGPAAVRVETCRGDPGRAGQAGLPGDWEGLSLTPGPTLCPLSARPRKRPRHRSRRRAQVRSVALPRRGGGGHKNLWRAQTPPTPGPHKNKKSKNKSPNHSRKKGARKLEHKNGYCNSFMLSILPIHPAIRPCTTSPRRHPKGGSRIGKPSLHWGIWLGLGQCWHTAPQCGPART